MLRVLHGDVTLAARALLLLPDERRPVLLSKLFQQAEAADRYRKLKGRVHKEWGNGSLMAAASRYPLANEPSFDCPDYCACTIMVIAAVKACAEGRFQTTAEFSALRGFEVGDRALD